MSSPGEDYNERRAEELKAHSERMASIRYNHLFEMYKQVGFGTGKTWAEVEIKNHLESAWQLLKLIKGK